MSGRTPGAGRRAASLLVMVVMVLGPALAAAASAAAATSLSVSSITGAIDPQGLTVGPDGTVWFTSEASSSIVRVSPNGQMKAFTSAGICDPTIITEGSPVVHR